LLRRVQALEAPKSSLKRLVFLGDTRLLDATAFSNICTAGEWPGIAFIGSENAKPFQVDLEPAGKGQMLYLSNRWAALADFERYSLSQGYPFDEGTAVVVDLDKTTVGARGRNAGVIDAARVLAVHETVADLLGENFNARSFQAAYDRLNQPEFHPFTADNQDYLAYICLVLGSGLYTLLEVEQAVSSGRLKSFRQFIRQVDDQKGSLPSALAEIHVEIYANVLAGDPTPFKAFRYTEYRTTIGRFGNLPDDTPVERLLAEEITITQEVRAMALKWKVQGALLFGLSDKPDEASCPTPVLAAQGYQPIHRTETHAVGD
jgi:hypothetical protein